MAKTRETARIELTRINNLLLEDKKVCEDALEEAEHVSKSFDEFMASYLTSKLYAEKSAEYKKDIKKGQLALKITKFSIIIGISLRDKKGTYPQLKPKYSETIDDYMAMLDTSGELCDFAEDIKQQYNRFELIYSILK
jgi:hypothetical protein